MHNSPLRFPTLKATGKLFYYIHVCLYVYMYMYANEVIYSMTHGRTSGLP